MKMNLGSSLKTNTAKGIVFQLADGTIQSCNTAAEQILGCTAEQLIGASTFNPPWQTIYEDGSPFSLEIHPAIVSLRTGQPCNDVIMGFYRLTGELIWLKIDSLPLFKAGETKPYGVEVSFRDITQQIQSQFIPPLELSRIISKKHLKVMLVEDCPEDRELYRRSLGRDEERHYTFIEAESGEQALELAQQQPPDLVLLDYLLPDMDGLEWLALWQEQNRESRPPVIVLTGQGDETIAVEFIKQGAADYLVKSQLTPGKLGLEVQRAIAEHQLYLEHQATLIELQRSEQHLRRVLDSLFTFVGVLEPNGLLIEVNRPALEAANLQPEDVTGKPFAQAYWWSYSTESQTRLNEAIARAKRGEAVRYDVEIRLSAENYIWIDFALAPLFDVQGKLEYIIPSGIDISDRKKSKQALELRERELKLITEVIPQQVWTALPDGEVDYINQRWRDFAGVTLEQIQNRGWESVVHPDDLERVIQAWSRAIETGNDYSIEARWREQNGRYHWFLNRAKPLRNEAGEITQWYGTNTDITQIKELEVQLQQQKKELIRANQLKDEFLAIVSHELRTPLNPILGWSQLLLAGRLSPEKTAQGVKIIQRNATLQAQLIEDLLDVSRILQGKLELKAMPLSLETVIRAAISTVQLAAEAKSIEIITRFEPDVEVIGDAGRLQQIVWNLVSNAIKFTSEGGRVTVVLKRVGRRALIQVTDTGKGIEPEFLPYVFERFRQADSSSTRKFGGLGLGLAIVRHLTELQGGTVIADSSGVGQGATFSVKLPLLNLPTIKSEGKQSNKRRETNPLNGLRVLIVDDEADSVDLLTFVLEQEGAIVTAVASANAAMTAFNRAKPDLIISDIQMPEVDGYTLMAQIRALPQGNNIPAIALTAYAGELDQQRSIDYGYQQHISKPINITELISVVTKLLPSD